MKDFDIKLTGRRIRELRRLEKLTQSSLAEKVNVAQNTITQYEKGTANPSLEVLVRLAITLHTSTDYLLGLSEDI